MGGVGFGWSQPLPLLFGLLSCGRYRLSSTIQAKITTAVPSKKISRADNA
jgi:hypothetical protein